MRVKAGRFRMRTANLWSIQVLAADFNPNSEIRDPKFFLNPQSEIRNSPYSPAIQPSASIQ
jgi:hypothetical protein